MSPQIIHWPYAIQITRDIKIRHCGNVAIKKQFKLVVKVLLLWFIIARYLSLKVFAGLNGAFWNYSILFRNMKNKLSSKYFMLTQKPHHKLQQDAERTLIPTIWVKQSFSKEKTLIVCEAGYK